MKEGYKKTEVGVIPEDWKVVKLGDIGEFKNGLNKGKEDFGFGYKFVNIQDAYVGTKVNVENLERINATNNEAESYSLKKGDIVLVRSSVKPSGVGYPILFDENCNNILYCGFMIRYRYNVDEYCAKYMLYQLRSSESRKKVLDLSTVSANTNINQDSLKMIKIPVPSLKEQEKIAEILSTVDCQIDDTEDLIEKCRVLKKGLMQRLLTKGIGNSEFKMSEVGEIPVGWDIKKLGEISIGKGQYGIGASATDYEEGNPRYLRITDIGDSGNLLNEDIKGLDDDNYRDYILEEGDIVFARTGNTTGKTYAYSKLDGDLVYAGFLIRFKLNSDIVMKDFVKYIVQTKRYWDWVKVMSTRSGQPGINSNEYSDFKVQIPTLEEQKKISNILLTLDNEIVEYLYKKQELNLLKKGLMQQLLMGNKRVYNY